MQNAPVYPGAPFFFSPQQMPPQQQGGRGFMYPQQMMMRPGPNVYQSMGQMANYGAMAMGKQGGGMQQRQGFQQRGPQGGQQMPRGGPPEGMAMPMQGGMPGGAPPAPQGPPRELNAATLAAAPPEQQKQLLGERLFPLIQNTEPQLAGKITGMLLEMDNGELLNLLESPDALNAKIMEALSVLQMHADSTKD